MPSSAEALASSFLQQRTPLSRQQACEVFDRLPALKSRRSAKTGPGKTFVVGAYVFSNNVGLTASFRDYPQSARVFTTLVRHFAPLHAFSSIAIFQNLEAPVHQDVHNAEGSLNFLIALSDFQEGAIIVEDPDGPERAVLRDQVMRGRVIPWHLHTLSFDARNQKHWTQPWKGSRTVLVAYSVRDLHLLSEQDAVRLRDAGFQLSSPKPEPPPAPPGPNPALALELFAGRGRLSQCLRAAGFQVVSVDHKVRGALVPICQLDLCNAACQQMILHLLQTVPPAFVHLGFPCGTSSRARDRPVPPHLRLAGVPDPKPLRSAEHPLGRPDIRPDSVDALKVAAANELYRFSAQVLRWCLENNVPVSLENPARSWAWAVLMIHVREWPLATQRAFNRLSQVLFDACEHGGSRAKRTKLLATAGLFEPPAVLCSGSHEHLPWGVRPHFSHWRFNTADEAEYPALLAQCMAARVRVFVQESRPSVFQSELRLRDLASAAAQKQRRRHPPLLPEFAEVLWVPRGQSSQPQFKTLTTLSTKGVDLGEDKRLPEDRSQPAAPSPLGFPSSPALGVNTTKETPSLGQGEEDFVRVGRFRSPQEFFDRAITLAHPVDTVNPVDQSTLDAIDFCASQSKQHVDMIRKLAILKLKLLIKKLAPEERRLHQRLPASVQKVVRNKNLLAWQALLQEHGFDDMDVFRLMTEGVRVTGSQPHPPAFDVKLVPATLSVQQLRETAKVRRQAMILDRGRPGDPEHPRLLLESTMEEVDREFLEGPFTQEEVNQVLGHDSWCTMRRFVLVQGSEKKLRPIDDASENQVNAACTSTVRLQLQDLDYVSAVALAISRRLGALPESEPWKGKTLDLSKAYKQVPLSPQDRDLCVVYFKGPDGKDLFFIPNALMFGAVAAVYSFNRISRSIGFLLNRLLKIPSCCYFDDFPLFSPSSSACEADASASEFLSLLGWDHAQSGSKGLPFESSFAVLGTVLDLSQVHKGQITLVNKPGRVERIVEEFTRASEVTAVTRHHLQVLQGLLNFASGFLLGRGLKHMCNELSDLGQWPHPAAVDTLRDIAKRPEDILRHSPPRVLAASAILEPIFIWTDGAWEPPRAGVGVVFFDSLSREGRVFEGLVPDSFLQQWASEQGHARDEAFLICQIELFVLSWVRNALKERLHHRRVIYFCDNDAARYAAVRGSSRVSSMLDLIFAFDAPDREYPSISWICRVPSFSNISDAPSRGRGIEVLEICGALKVEPMEGMDSMASLWASRRKRKGG